MAETVAVAAAGVAIKAAVDVVVKLAVSAYGKWQACKNLKGDAKELQERVAYVTSLVERFGEAVDKLDKDDEGLLGLIPSLKLKVKAVDHDSKPLLKKVHQKSVLKRSFYNFVGPSISEQIKKLKDDLKEVIEAIFKAEALAATLANLGTQPSSHVIADEKARQFWNKHVGTQEWRGPFNKILGGYLDEIDEPAAGSAVGGRSYRKLGKEDCESFLYALCCEEEDETVPQRLHMDKEEVSCFTFNAFCTKYGWPFYPETLPTPPKIRIVHSTFERLTVAQMCLDLQKEFSSREMRQLMDFVRVTVDSVVEHMMLNIHGDGRIRCEGQYGPYQLFELVHPTDDGEQKKFRDEQMRCFAADYLYRDVAKEAAALEVRDAGAEKAAAEKAQEVAAQNARDSGAIEPERSTVSEAQKINAPTEDKRKAPDLPVMTAAYVASDAETKRTKRDVLDENRRLWSFVFQRFATLWKLGRLEEELFEGIDFPGTNRAITFIKYCELLDEANLRLAIKKNFERPSFTSEPGQAVEQTRSEKWKKNETVWDNARPQVYSFLRAWIQYKDETDADTRVGKPRAAGLPTRVRFGGIVIPLEDDGTPREVRRATAPPRNGTERTAERNGGHAAPDGARRTDDLKDLTVDVPSVEDSGSSKGAAAGGETPTGVQAFPG